jgi:hypothetical protein
MLNHGSGVIGRITSIQLQMPLHEATVAYAAAMRLYGASAIVIVARFEPTSFS